MIQENNNVASATLADCFTIEQVVETINHASQGLRSSIAGLYAWGRTQSEYDSELYHRELIAHLDVLVNNGAHFGYLMALMVADEAASANAVE